MSVSLALIGPYPSCTVIHEPALSRAHVIEIWTLLEVYDMFPRLCVPHLYFTMLDSSVNHHNVCVMNLKPQSDHPKKDIISKRRLRLKG